MPTFAHLHLHTGYSLLDGAIRIDDLVKTVPAMGMDSVAVTDHGNMYGAIHFYKAAKEAKIKAILGVEAYIVRGDHTVKSKEAGRNLHLVLLARDMEGYYNLAWLLSEANRNGFYYKPRIDHAMLASHAGGLIGLSACMHGEVASLLIDGRPDEARAAALRYRDLLGEGNFFLEVQANGLDGQDRVNDQIAQLADDTGIPLVGTNDSHYLRAQDAKAHDILLAIGEGKNLDDPNRLRYGTDQLYLKTPEEMTAALGRYPGAIENTLKIAERCNVSLKLKDYRLPQFPVPEGVDLGDFLAERARQGLTRRLAEVRAQGREVDEQAYRDRLELEVGVIKKTGYPGYFLVVSDFIGWAKDHGIPVGPGRGSGAGSVVAWCLRITELDPLRYNLLFERFLNLERVSLPDFDVDFCQDRREEVIQYVTHKYGADKVAQIVTFGTLKAKAVLRDVGRVLGMPYKDVDAVAKLVPEKLGIKLGEAIAMEPKLQALMADPLHKQLLETGLALEGLNRHAGIHAAGVVITDQPLNTIVPMGRGANGEVITQYSKDDAEAAGLVKFDFLGLKTLTVIDTAVRWVNRRLQPGEPSLDINSLTVDDPAVFELLSRGDTTGVFQVESAGFTAMVKRMMPSRFEDIIAAGALYRPGPLDQKLEDGRTMVDVYIDRKHGRDQVAYDHPWLEPILRDTYGVIVYQEQVMQIAQVLAGYSLGNADILRRAMGKKKAEEMAKQRAGFMEGAHGLGVEAKVAGGVFDLMEKFAAYGFNKSHSAAYGLITYQTAWLKAHHPSEFMCAILTSEKSNTDKLLRYVSETRRMGIQVLPPDVNHSEEDFSIDGEAIRFGLGAVKGVGSGAVQAIIEARAAGPFASLADFCERVDLRRVNRKVLEALIKGAAFDSLNTPRSVLLNNLERAMDWGARRVRERAEGQLSLLGGLSGDNGSAGSVDFRYEGEDSWSTRDALAAEREALGFHLTNHPLNRHASQIAQMRGPVIADLLETDKKESFDVELVAIIAASTIKVSKSSQKKFASLTLEDLTGRIEGVLWPEAYATNEGMVECVEPLMVKGRVLVEGDEDQLSVKLVVEALKLFSEAGAGRTRRVRVRSGADRMPRERVERFKELLAAHRGDVPVYLVVEHAGRQDELVLSNDWTVHATPALYDGLEKIFGPGNVKFA
jgi:DNA polymerase-3 subunit alpha